MRKSRRQPGFSFVLMQNTTHHYRYADRVVAATLDLPELPECPTPAAVAFHIGMGHCEARGEAAPTWQHDFLDPLGAISLTCSREGDGFRFQFPGLVEALAAATGEITLHASPTASPNTVRHILLDQILPRLLAQQGELVLHGAAIAPVEGRAVVLLGDSGMGKSTLSGASALAGHQVLTDDGLLVRVAPDGVAAIPTYPSLRLWPDSFDTLFAGSDVASAPMAHYSDKQRLDLAATPQPATCPIAAIVVLKPPEGDRIIQTQLSSQAACMALMRNAFQLDLSDHQNVSRLLGIAAKTVGCVPTIALSYPRDFARLPEVVEALRMIASQ
jgi:hypothetical protein